MDKNPRLFILMGVVLIAAAFTLAACNIAQSRRAERSSADAAAQLSQAISAAEPESGPEPQAEMPTVEIDGRLYIGALYIPVLERELPVLSECDEAGLKIAPCRYAGSVYTGNMVICAHNLPAHLGGLKELKFGEKLFFTDVNGKSYEFVVKLLETLAPTAVEEMIGSEWDLTLFTCTVGGSARVTVRCELV